MSGRQRAAPEGVPGGRHGPGETASALQGHGGALSPCGHALRGPAAQSGLDRGGFALGGQALLGGHGAGAAAARTSGHAVADAKEDDGKHRGKA